MYRHALTAAAAAALLASCGPRALELPADPVDRAATCGVVAAAAARTATNIQQSLSFDAQGKILHYALLAGSSGKSFSPEIASKVSKRMTDLQEGITEGDWQKLKPACAAAYPEAEKTNVELPANSFDTQLGCDSLADFFTTVLKGREADYGNQLSDFRLFHQKMNRQLGPGMNRRAGSDVEAQQGESRRALATFARLGPPSAVMQQCLKRYG